jgi:hypothetical protein
MQRGGRVGVGWGTMVVYIEGRRAGGRLAARYPPGTRGLGWEARGQSQGAVCLRGGQAAREAAGPKQGRQEGGRRAEGRRQHSEEGGDTGPVSSSSHWMLSPLSAARVEDPVLFRRWASSTITVSHSMSCRRRREGPGSAQGLPGSAQRLPGIAWGARIDLAPARALPLASRTAGATQEGK